MSVIKFPVRDKSAEISAALTCALAGTIDGASPLEANLAIGSLLAAYAQTTCATGMTEDVEAIIDMLADLARLTTGLTQKTRRPN